MILRDWREADDGLLRACYQAEWRSWRDDLAWDSAWTWATVEQARAGGRLPGLLAVDPAGGVQGWAFYLLESGTRHVGSLVAASRETTAALLDAVLEPAADERVACFVRDRAPGLREALADRGFDVERFLYLARPLDASYGASGFLGRRSGEREGGSRTAAPPVLSGFSRTSASDLAAAAWLLRASYSPDIGCHFAPDGTIEEWTTYVASLVQQGGCGLLDESMTCAVRDAAGLQALALVTTIAPETAHLAQLAVRPDCRGRHIASALLQETITRAARAGKASMTLLVGERNARARALYASHGFTECGTFIAARREMTLARRSGAESPRLAAAS